MLLYQWKGANQTKEDDDDRYELPSTDPKIIISKGGGINNHAHHKVDKTQTEALDFLDIALLVISDGHACSGCTEVVRCGAAAEKEENDSIRQDDHEKMTSAAAAAPTIVENLEVLEQERPADIPELLAEESFHSIEEDDISAVSSDTLEFMEVQRSFFCLDLDFCSDY